MRAGDFATAAKPPQDQGHPEKTGVDSGIVRRVSIAAYEVELNLVIHSKGERWTDRPAGLLALNVRDVGPGIPDIDLAMQEGYSTRRTTSDDGLCAAWAPQHAAQPTDFSIRSEVGVGTTIEMGFKL